MVGVRCTDHVVHAPADIVINNKKKELILQVLKQKGYRQFRKNAVAGEAEEDDSAVVGGGYDYLLSMPLWSLTMEKVAQLEVWGCRVA